MAKSHIQQKKNKFIQIFKVQYGDLYALDENGDVWKINTGELYLGKWERLSNEREEK